jgi:hypothetical protein
MSQGGEENSKQKRKGNCRYQQSKTEDSNGRSQVVHTSIIFVSGLFPSLGD